MIVAMQETATEDQIQVVVEHLMEMGFSVHRTTGERQTILAAVGARADFDTRNLEVLSGVKAGARGLRGGAFKPRSSPYSFQGLGLEALELLREAGEKYNLLVISEVMEISQIEVMLPYVDILQVGARNMQNFNLLRELGKLKTHVLLKRGSAATLEELLLSAEYIMAGGNYNIIVCERGIRTFETYTRNTMDISAIPVVHKLSHLPIASDPSHGTGRRDKVSPMAMASIAAGADALLIEVHHDPDKALSDGAQSLYPHPMTRSPIARFFSMPIQQITIVGTGLIGGSLGLALKKGGFRGKIVGCDSKAVLARAKRRRAIDRGVADPIEASQGSDVVVLATPVGSIIELIERLAPRLSSNTLLTDVGSTKAEIVSRAGRAFGKDAARRFLAGHPMAGKENSGIAFADAGLFRGAVWFVTPLPGQESKTGVVAEYLRWVRKTGARIAALDASEHDQLCAWISHVPQMISTALAATLVEEYGENAPLLESGGRALREMTRIAASPYSMWRDIAITNKKQIADALLKLEQKLAHIRENLDTRGLEEEFELAHGLKNSSAQRHRATGKAK